MAANNNGYWPYTVWPGDVLVDAKGVVRKVLHSVQGKSGYTTTVMFLIKRKSWTTRPVTTYIYTDLKRLGFRPIPNVKIAITLMEAIIIKENTVSPANNPESLRYHSPL